MRLLTSAPAGVMRGFTRLSPLKPHHSRPTATLSPGKTLLDNHNKFMHYFNIV